MSLTEQGIIYRRTNTFNNSIYSEDILNINGIENAINIEANYNQVIPQDNTGNTYFNYSPTTIYNYDNNLDNNEEFSVNDNIILVNGRNHPTNPKFIKNLIINEIVDIKKCPKKECCICLQNFKIGDNFISLPCIHIFHSECIINWMELNNVCPLCKYELTCKNFIRTKELK